MIIGDMEIRLRADIARLQADMTAARRVVSDTASGIGRAADQMKAALAAIGLGTGLAQIIQMSDQYTKFTAQLRLATTSQREYNQALADVKRISTDAQSSMAGAGTLYARIANGVRELGTSQQQVAKITEVVSLALKVSGATTEESASAMLQLSQAFGSGVLRGQEFNAVNEAAPRLMKALADGMGVPIGALRSMADNGEITSKMMAEVLPAALGKLREESKQIQTIGGAFQVLKDRVMEFTAVHAQANGTVALLTAGIGLLANNLDLLMGAVTVMTAAKLGAWLSAWTADTYKQITAAAALRAANVALLESEMANSTAKVAQLAGTQAMIVIAREEAMAKLSSANANISMAESAIAASTAAGAQSFALRTLRLATAELAVAEAQRAAMIAELAILGRQQASVAAQVATATAAQTAAQNSLNASTGAGVAAAGIARGAIAFLGGPVGALITVLGIAALAWSHWGKSAKDANEQAKGSTEDSHATIIKSLDAQIEKNEALIRLRKQGMSLDDAKKVDQKPLDELAALSSQLAALNRGEGMPSGASNEDRLFKRLDIEKQILETTTKIGKAQSTGAEATKLTQAEARKAFMAEYATKDEQLNAKLAEADKLLGAAFTDDDKARVRAAFADKSIETAIKKEAAAYDTLIASIRTKIDENNLELVTGTESSESQKASIKVTQELASGKLKLSDAHLVVVRAALSEQAATEALLKQQTAQKDVTKFIVASTAARNDAAASLDAEYSMYGKSNDARDIAMVAIKAETAMQKQLDDLREKKLPISDQVIAQLKAERDARTLVEQAALAQTKALDYASSLKTENTKFAAESIADPKARADALLKIDADVWQERIRLAGEGTKAQQLLQDEYNTWYKNQSNKVLVDVDLTRATELLKILESVDAAARQAASGMESSFGAVGKAIGGLTTALSGYAVEQQAIAASLAAVKADPKSGADKIRKAEADASKASAQAQIKSYGDMASAAKGFFKENSTGYKVMEATEKTFRAVEMAMAIENMLAKSGLLTAFTGLFVASKATETAADTAATGTSVVNSGIRAAADGVAAFAKTLASLPFPFNIAAGAAVIALLAGVGVAIGGGGGGVDISKQRQEAQGSGTVFGDSTAKSDSIARALELTAANSNIELSHTAGMLQSLRAIESNIGGLANVLIRNSGLTGSTTIADTKGAAENFVNSTLGTAILGGGLGLIINKLTGGLASSIIGKIAGALFGGAKTVQDTGLMVDSATVGQIAQSGAHAIQYTGVATSGGLFSHGSYDEIPTELGNAANDQISKVILGLSNSVKTAAGLLGISGKDFTDSLDAFKVDLGHISLKGMSTTQIQDALQAVFSTLGDKMASSAVAGLTALAKAGEGPLETLTRVATDYANVDSVLAALGGTFGATGLASIAAREDLIALSGGIDKLASGASTFSDNFLSEAEKLAPVQTYVTEQLAAMGYAGIDTRDKFKDVVLGLVQSGALATTAGQQQYTGLIALSSAFAQAYAASTDLTKSTQAIADEQKDLQGQYDQLTMTSTQLRAKERTTIDASNQALFDAITAEQARQDAIATANSVLDLQAQYFASIKDTASAAAVAELQHQAAMVGLTGDLATWTQKTYEADKAAKAAAATASEVSSILAAQAATYAANGNAAAAAAVLLQQHTIALAAMTPAVAAATQAQWDAEAAAAAQTKATTESNNILTQRAALYAAIGDKAGAAAVLELQHTAALVGLTPALAAATQAAWDAQAAQKATADAITESNSVLSAQATMYEANGDAAGAAAVLLLQHEAALVGMSPALASATQAMWDAQAAAKAVAATNAARDLEIQLMDLQGDKIGALAAKRALELAQTDKALQPMTAMIAALSDLKSAQDAYDSAVSSAKSAMQAAAGQYQAFVDAVTTTQKALVDAQKAIRDEYDQALKADTDAKKAVQAEQDKITEGYIAASKAVADAQMKISDGFYKLGQTINEFLDSLNTTDLGGLSKDDQLANLQSSLAITAAQAKAGSIDAGGQLPEIAKNILALGKDTTASQVDYMRLVAGVRSTLSSVAVNAARQGAASADVSPTADLDAALAQQKEWATAVTVAGASFTKTGDAVTTVGGTIIQSAGDILASYQTAHDAQLDTSIALKYWAQVAAGTGTSLVDTKTALATTGDTVIKAFFDAQQAAAVAQINLDAANTIRNGLDLRQTTSLEAFVDSIKNVNTTAQAAVDAGAALFAAASNSLLAGSEAAATAQAAATAGMTYWGTVVTTTAAGIAASVQAMATAAAAIAAAQATSGAASTAASGAASADENMVRGWYAGSAAYQSNGTPVTSAEVQYWLRALQGNSVATVKAQFDTAATNDAANAALVKSWYANNSQFQAHGTVTAEGIAYWVNALKSEDATTAKTQFAAAAARDAGFATPLSIDKFATGAAFRDGVVSRPTNFDIGQMGEAGDEAIMPLANVGGRLGVRAMVGGGQDNTALIAEVRALRQELAALRTDTRAGDAANVSATKAQTSLLRDLTEDGTALKTIPADA